MTEAKPVRTDVTAADMDAQGRVVVWDHGPREWADPDRESEAFKRHEAEAARWRDAHGDGPVPITMHASDAGHAISVEPDRYALEPLNIDDGEVEAEVKAIQERRTESEKFASDQRDAVQYAADRKIAIATLHAKRLSDEAAKENEERTPKPRPPAKAREPQRPASADKAEADRRAEAEERARMNARQAERNRPIAPNQFNEDQFNEE